MPFKRQTDSFGRIRLTFPAGDYLFEACAPGYDSMRVHYPVIASKALSLGFEMHPIVLPPEERPDVLDAQMRRGYAMTYGYIVDADTGRPLADVRVRFEGSKVETKSNARGYYALFSPASPSNPDPAWLPATDTLVAELSGYKRFVYNRFPMFEGQASGTNVALEQGSGATETTFSARWMPGNAADMQAQEEPVKPGPPISPRLLQWLSVPAHSCPQ